MKVYLRNTAEIDTELLVRRIRWASSPLRQFGEAELFIPPGHAAFSTAYVDDENGESYVRITHDTLGEWAGVVCVVDAGEGGATVIARDLGWLLSRRNVGQNRTFQALTAGLIVRQAVQDGFAGLAGSYLGHGSYLEAAPVVASYQFRGQSVAAVLGDMQAATGHDWSVTLSQGGALVNWLPPLGTLSETHLSEDAHLVGAGVRMDASERIAEATARGTDGTVDTVTDGESAGSGLISGQSSVSVSSTSRAAIWQAARAELAARHWPLTVYRADLRERAATVVTNTGGPGQSRLPRFLSGSSAPPVTLSLAVGADLWSSVREGTVLLCHLPHAGIAAASPVVRVLSREWTEGSPYLSITLQYLRPLTAQTQARLAAELTVPPLLAPAKNDPIRRLLALDRSVQKLVAP